MPEGIIPVRIQIKPVVVENIAEFSAFHIVFAAFVFHKYENKAFYPQFHGIPLRSHLWKDAEIFLFHAAFEIGVDKAVGVANFIFFLVLRNLVYGICRDYAYLTVDDDSVVHAYAGDVHVRRGLDMLLDHVFRDLACALVGYAYVE